jgi:membrane protein required for colicin V production
MSPVDIAIVIILLVSTLIGVFRGFIRETLSLISWVVAFYIAWTFAPLGAVYLEPYLSQPPLRIVAAFVAIFLVALISASIIAYLVYRLFALAGVGGIDRSLGLVFGVARGVLLVAVLILAGVYTDFATQPWWQTSKLVGFFSPITDFLLTLLPADVVENFKPGVV